MNGRSPTAQADRPPVHVLATTVEGTRCALTSAKRLTERLHARVVLLVPRLTSFSVPFDPASDEAAVLIDEHRALAEHRCARHGAALCVSRYGDVVHQMLSQSSLLVIGGRKRVWWPSREERLVSRLFAEGYPVVFAQVGADPGQAVLAVDGS
jgi:hypothetical protein